MLPTVTWLQTTPLTCHVGSPSADTVVGDPASGCVSACAGAVMTASHAATMLNSDTITDDRARPPRRMKCSPQGVDPTPQERDAPFSRVPIGSEYVNAPICRVRILDTNRLRARLPRPWRMT